MKTKTKKRNPQDATLRNINALKKRVKKLEEDRSEIAEILGLLQEQICLLLEAHQSGKR